MHPESWWCLNDLLYINYKLHLIKLYKTWEFNFIAIYCTWLYIIYINNIVIKLNYMLQFCLDKLASGGWEIFLFQKIRTKIGVIYKKKSFIVFCQILNLLYTDNQWLKWQCKVWYMYFDFMNTIGTKAYITSYSVICLFRILYILKFSLIRTNCLVRRYFTSYYIQNYPVYSESCTFRIPNIKSSPLST